MSNYPNNERGVRANMGAGTFGEHPASGPAPTTAGHHKHDVLNKLDPRVDSTQDRRPVATMIGNTGNNNVPAGTYGPHSSRVANALDPRVDSDLSRGAAAGGPMMHGGADGTRQGMMSGTGHGQDQGAPEGTYGPHSSRVANALDPRVDSDMDGRGATGYNGGGAVPGAAAGATGYGSNTAGAGFGPAAGAGEGGYGQTVGGGLGRHGQQQGYGQQGYGVGGNAVNNAALSGPGPAPNTTGPHHSDLLNKLDPRVDSKTGMKKESGYTERRGV